MAGTFKVVTHQVEGLASRMDTISSNFQEVGRHAEALMRAGG